MVIVLYNCFDWIGYHFARQLLHRGHEVIGVDEIDSEKKEELYLYVGRNSHFQYFTSAEQRLNHCHECEEEVHVLIDRSGVEVKQKDRSIETAEIPALYGEWMEINCEEIETIDDLQFWIIQHQAVYIEDFVEDMISIIEGRKESLKIEREGGGEQPKEILEKIWNIHLKGGEFLY
ncbi:hypothetical protein [Halobacillus massiliensis]|uniref:hypothetical protein n=1 Tax=Halobacillus massiliensis TaxID=1926286 RepID=UPI0009E30534|nr:hypothetical protein [Halobacillus massiliensis]